MGKNFIQRLTEKVNDARSDIIIYAATAPVTGVTGKWYVRYSAQIATYVSLFICWGVFKLLKLPFWSNIMGLFAVLYMVLLLWKWIEMKWNLRKS